MRLLRRLSYANVAATLALFFALAGTAVAGANLLVTGANVEDHSLTGVDIKHGSLGMRSAQPGCTGELKGARGPARRVAQGQQGSQGDAGAGRAAGGPGPQGPAGPQGATGMGVTTATTTGPGVTNYQDLTPLVSHPLPAAATT